MRHRFVVVIAVVVALATPAYAQTSSELTQADVDAALQRRKDASAQLESMTARFEQASADEEMVRDRIGVLARSVAALEQDIGERRVQVRELVKSRYMSGGSTGTERVFSARNFSDIPVQNRYLELLNNHDLSILNGLQAAEALQVDQQRQLDRTLADQQALVAEIGDLAQQLTTALEDANAEYNEVALAFQAQEEERKRLEEEARQRQLEEERKRREAEAAAAAAATSTTTTVAATTTTSAATTTTQATTTTTTTQATTTTTTLPSVPPPVITDGKTCPVNAAVTFSDTWGAPRSGGRTHKGVDMFAARNSPVVAIESGTVTRTSNSTLGGLSVYLTGESGSKYYYAHLEYIADGITGGTPVSVGQLFGGVGTSGNAPDWLPHLHFQYAPPGSDWIDPYPLVKALCG